MTATVSVTAPGRLHFGLLGFGDASERQFGGVGVMIEQPSLELQMAQAEQSSSHGPSCDRIGEFVKRWSEFHQLPPPACRIEVLHAPRPHIGLGSGTQLGLAVAAGLNRLYQLDSSIVDTARSVARGLRSAIGTYGFFQGGLIWEQGKTADETISPLDRRVALPAAWRFVLICPQHQAGLSGEGERTAMAGLPAVPLATQNRLRGLVEQRMLPAIAAQDCDLFGEAVYEYGRCAGEAFSSVQGGPYNGQSLERLVERIRDQGGVGVGQSSWGPTIYVAVADEPTAHRLVGQLRTAGDLNGSDVWISRPNNEGARIQVQE